MRRRTKRRIWKNPCHPEEDKREGGDEGWGWGVGGLEEQDE